MTPYQLRRRIKRLSANMPITSQFEAVIKARQTRTLDTWYSSQKQHWLGWLSEYNGPGYYDRQTWNVTAETVYNRAGNPSMVLWLGEASGVDPGKIEKASIAALSASDNMASQCAAIRREIPWNYIEAQLLKHRHQWWNVFR